MAKAAEQAHTAGPWRVEGTNSNLVYAPDGWIADIRSGTKANSKETSANARLIAAAPDLLAALKDTTRILDAVRMSAGLGKKQIERVEAAKAAIAKSSAA